MCLYYVATVRQKPSLEFDERSVRHHITDYYKQNKWKPGTYVHVVNIHTLYIFYIYVYHTKISLVKWISKHILMFKYIVSVYSTVLYYLEHFCQFIWNMHTAQVESQVANIERQTKYYFCHKTLTKCYIPYVFHTYKVAVF